MGDSLTQMWQKINAHCHFCHWWRKLDEDRISAMNTETIILLIVALASLAALAETLREVFHDGPAAQDPPRSHHVDSQLAPPSSWAA
jgi:hypothetical protein